MKKLATRAVYFRKRAVYFRKRTPCICPRARYSCRRALYSAKEPYVLAKEPCIPTKEPYVSVQWKNKEEQREAHVIDNKVGLKSHIFPHKSPVHLQKSSPTREPSPRIRKRDLYARKKGICNCEVGK